MNVQRDSRAVSVRELSQLLENQCSAYAPAGNILSSNSKLTAPGTFTGLTDQYSKQNESLAAPEQEIDSISSLPEVDYSDDDESCADAIYQNMPIAASESNAPETEIAPPVADLPHRNRTSSADQIRGIAEQYEQYTGPNWRAFSESHLQHGSHGGISLLGPLVPGNEDSDVTSPMTTSSVDSFYFDSDYDDENTDDVFEHRVHEEETPNKPPSKDSNIEVKLHAIAKELLTTEEGYLENLHIIVKVLLVNVTVMNKIEFMLPKDAVGRIFSNLQQIYEFHHDTLLPRLRECIYSWPLHQRLGGVLKSVAPFFNLYADYTKTFKESIELVNSWSQRNHTFRLLVKEIESMPECKRRKITHLMLEPISRLPKYQALMKTYLQYLLPEAEDRRDTEDALVTITKVAMHSQELGKKDQNFYRVLEIQRRIVGKINLLNSPRQLVKEGTVTLIDAKTTTQKERYMILLDDMLLLCGFSGMSAVQLRLREGLMLKNLEVIDGNNPEFPCSFFLKSKAKTFHVNARSPEVLSQWLTALRHTLKQYSRKASTFTAASKQPVQNTKENLGVGKCAPILSLMSAVSMCANCKCAFSTFRKKHHCKGCGQVMCAKCLSHKVSLEYDNMKLGKVCENCNEKILHKNPDFEQKQTSDASVVCNGFLQISGDDGKTWNRRWFVLKTNKELFSFKAYQDVEPLTRMPVWRYQVAMTAPDDKVSQKYTFKMANNLNEYFFQADDYDMLNKWLTVLQDVTCSQ